jgi:hypothetical protein
MTTVYRHEASAQRFLKVIVWRLDGKVGGGAYRLNVYPHFVHGGWTHRDFFVGLFFGHERGWFKWDPISTFVSLTQSGYDTAKNDNLDFDEPPVDFNPWQRPAATESTVETKNARTSALSLETEKQNRLQPLREGGWIDTETGQLVSEIYTPTVEAYLREQIGFDECEQLLLAIFYAQMYVPSSIRDD